MEQLNLPFDKPERPYELATAQQLNQLMFRLDLIHKQNVDLAVRLQRLEDQLTELDERVIVVLDRCE